MGHRPRRLAEADEVRAFILENKLTCKEYDAARRLRADVRTTLFPGPTTFPRYYGHTFNTLIGRPKACGANARPRSVHKLPPSTRRLSETQLARRAEKQRERYRTDPVYREERKKVAAVYYVENSDRVHEYLRGRYGPARRDQVYYAGLRTKYGIERAQLEELQRAQQGRCAACGDPPRDGRRLFIDHCHDTGKVRSLLCHYCNSALGYLKDSPERCGKLFQYINRWKRSTQREDAE